MASAQGDLIGISGCQGAGLCERKGGRSGDLEISVCDIAKKAGTITNEILSRMGTRLERIMVDKQNAGRAEFG